MNGVSPPLPLYALMKRTGLLIFFLPSLILEVRTEAKERGLTAAILSLPVAQKCPYICIEILRTEPKVRIGTAVNPARVRTLYFCNTSLAPYHYVCNTYLQLVFN
jgi:hypothetical protein